MAARIYKPTKTPTQGGLANGQRWLLEYEPEEARRIEPLMGWTSSRDMRSQIKLWFTTREEAVDYAERNGLAYRVEEPKPVIPRGRTYADNFNPDRKALWTH